uniref:U-box domain-containing protein n=1 Tax=Chlamydomonas leiostraca TaxID=1034604 RepID=A0A7S0RSC2_9CHLO|mmetsp:Transcript_29900/g.76138  ORF Transcript_29900/g.76138 Transcript_29900/m.76138 type:complete len:213 (+) Transcript_29900:641-1279(+)
MGLAGLGAANGLGGNGLGGNGLGAAGLGAAGLGGNGLGMGGLGNMGNMGGMNAGLQGLQGLQGLSPSAMQMGGAGRYSGSMGISHDTAAQQLQHQAAQAQVAAAQAAQLSQLAAMSGHKQLPATFFCPLSRTLMADPVVAADGVTYERGAISEWLQGNNVSPVTRQPMANKFLAPNYSVKAAILTHTTSTAGAAMNPAMMMAGMGGHLGGGM